MARMITKPKSLGMGSGGLLTTSIRRQESPTLGLMGFPTWVCEDRSDPPYQCSPEAMLHALLTHSRYLLPRELYLGRGLVRPVPFRPKRINLPLAMAAMTRSWRMPSPRS